MYENGGYSVAAPIIPSNTLESFMMRFEDKVVIVTGAGTGIGAATAKRFLLEGATVVLNGRREQKLRDTTAGLETTK